MDQIKPSLEIDITILVTCYNEEELIEDTLDHVIEALKISGLSYEIIVIDDVSKDRSTDRVRSYIQTHDTEPIRLIANSVNRGLANNYVEAAFAGKGKYYRLCCGDDSEPVEALVNIFSQVGKADIIIPYQEQDSVAGKSAQRRSISKLFTSLVNLITGYKLRYYNGSAVQLRYNVMRWHPSSYGFGFQADILSRLLDEGATYMQVKSFGNDRKGGESTALNTRNILSVGHTLLELAIRRIRRAMYGKNMTKPREVFPS
jgi:glycosyltransferase involved in cell wall biosynthesis